MNILEALDDPELFAPHFRAESWRPWRAFLKAWAGLGAEMSAEEVELFRRHTGRITPPVAPFREATLICGRRGGKSRILGLMAVYLATFRDYAAHLAPGEVATVAVIGADRKQARTIMRYIAGLLHGVSPLEAMIDAEGPESVALTNRVVIEVATASWRVTRGYSFAAVLADELAFWRDESSANPAPEILRAVRPGLATIPGACLLKASSPHGRKGPLWDDYRRFYGKDDGRVLVWQAPTLAMNPTLDPSIVAEAEEDDPQAAQAEYGALFRDDVADFVSREVIDACVVPGRYELPRIGGARYVAFCDPSGGSNDSMTLAIGHAEGKRVVLDCVRETRAPFSPDSVVEEFAETLRSYGLSEVSGDRYAGQWPVERFAAHGITYTPAEQAKSQLYLALLPALNSGRVELLDVPRLAGQLSSLERRTARGGRDSVDHPAGAHDDLANAAAGALVMVSTPEHGGYDLMRLVGQNPDGMPIDGVDPYARLRMLDSLRGH